MQIKSNNGFDYFFRDGIAFLLELVYMYLISYDLIHP